jgi:hypothetical protein
MDMRLPSELLAHVTRLHPKVTKAREKRIPSTLSSVHMQLRAIKMTQGLGPNMAGPVGPTITARLTFKSS